MINAFKANLTGSTVVIDPADSDSSNVVFGEINSGTFTIPAGCFWVKIENAGLVVSGDSPGNITVNGGTFTVGRIEVINANFDNANNTFFTLPSFAIVTAGSRVRYSYAN